MKKIILGLLIPIFITAGVYAEEKSDKKKPAEKPRVAVMDFDSIGEGVKEADLGRAVAENLRTEIIQTGEFRVIERAALKKLFEEQQLQFSGAIDQESAVKVGKIAGAERLILGSVTKIGNTYTINIRFIDVETSVATKAEKLYGNVDELPMLVEGIVKLLMGEEWKRKPVRTSSAVRAREPQAAAQPAVQPAASSSQQNVQLGLRTSSNFKSKNGEDLVSGTLHKNEAYDKAQHMGFYMLFANPANSGAFELAYDRYKKEWELGSYTGWVQGDAEWTLSLLSMSLQLRGSNVLAPYAGVGLGLAWWKDTQTYQQYSYSSVDEDVWSSDVKPAFLYMLGVDVNLGDIFAVGIEYRYISVKIEEVNHEFNGTEGDPLEGDFTVKGGSTNLHLAVRF